MKNYNKLEQLVLNVVKVLDVAREWKHLHTVLAPQVFLANEENTIAGLEYKLSIDFGGNVHISKTVLPNYDLEYTIQADRLYVVGINVQGGYAYGDSIRELDNTVILTSDDAFKTLVEPSRAHFKLAMKTELETDVKTQLAIDIWLAHGSIKFEQAVDVVNNKYGLFHSCDVLGIDRDVLANVATGDDLYSEEEDTEEVECNKEFYELPF